MANQTKKHRAISTTSSRQKCLACGTDQIKAGRRYCTNECRQQLEWVLSLSKGLLRTLNTKYAAFFFTCDDVVLDILPVWSKSISRFAGKREKNIKPAKDLKNMILQASQEWYNMVHKNTSRSHASLLLINNAQNKDIDPETIKPNRKSNIRLTKHENNYLKILNLDREDLKVPTHQDKIKTAYKKLAKIHHPDKGGDDEKFKQLNEAHKMMLLWTEDPKYTHRKALQDCWSYNGATNRWTPPL